MSLVRQFTADHEEYLRDESRMRGSASAIAFPTSPGELREALAEARVSGSVVTIQGGRTGITGGAVPQQGTVINLSKMTSILGLRFDPSAQEFFLSVQPGTRLSDITEALDTRTFDVSTWSSESTAALAALKDSAPRFFAPDPTETTASIGGMVACNASGARSFLYGPVRRHVESVEVVLADGRLSRLRRGQCTAEGRRFRVPTGAGRPVEGTLPSYAWPTVKNAAGYMAADAMDMLDLIVGMEGTLGVVAAVELRLLPRPSTIWGLLCFMHDETSALHLVRALRGENVPAVGRDPALRPAAMEFFNGHGLDMLRHERATNAAFAPLPEIAEGMGAALYVEYHGNDATVVEEAAMGVSELVVSLGGSDDSIWLADTGREMDKLKFFRHALPEAVNLAIDQRRRIEPQITKLGTDLSVPDTCLETVMAMYAADLEASGLQSVIFGHIGDNHVHVNVLPRSMDDYRRGKELYAEWAKRVVAMGGSVSAEHGIGKLKREFLETMYGQKGIDQMRAVKRAFDPEGMLNPGNLFV